MQLQTSRVAGEQKETGGLSSLAAVLGGLLHWLTLFSCSSVYLCDKPEFTCTCTRPYVLLETEESWRRGKARPHTPSSAWPLPAPPFQLSLLWPLGSPGPLHMLCLPWSLGLHVRVASPPLLTPLFRSGSRQPGPGLTQGSLCTSPFCSTLSCHIL